MMVVGSDNFGYLVIFYFPCRSDAGDPHIERQYFRQDRYQPSDCFLIWFYPVRAGSVPSASQGQKNSQKHSRLNTAYFFERADRRPQTSPVEQVPLYLQFKSLLPRQLPVRTQDEFQRRKRGCRGVEIV